MIHAEIWVSEDEGAANALRSGLIPTREQYATFKCIAAGKAHRRQVIEQANSYLERGLYKAVRVFKGKAASILVYQACAQEQPAHQGPGE